MANKPTKKVVRVERKESKPPSEPTWKPTAEAKGKATRLRLIAMLLWLVAIAGEAATIIWVLNPEDTVDEAGATVAGEVNMVLLIAAIVVIGILAIIGSVLWKKANRADPAKRSEPIRFWIQNQLGLIISIIAFLPLIVLIFLNKDMDSKQKGIAGSIAIVVALVAAYFGMSFDSPSVEQYTAETQRVIELTGEDLVVWTTFGDYYHLCEDVPAVNLESSDPQIFKGTVGDAHAYGKKGITLELPEELAACGLPIPENVDEIVEEIRQERE
ncbi:MAG: hypothetical protein JW722_07975 [Demequinaceae bacterium]|nr:hypothetical protein [Demequinaceae bacterium]